MKVVDIIWFISIFVVIYSYYIFRYIFSKKKKYDPNKVPLELAYLIVKYRLDMKKVNYKKIMALIGFIMAFDIALVSIIMICFIKNIYISILLGVLLLLIIVYISLKFVGIYFEKKGLVINGNK